MPLDPDVIRKYNLPEPPLADGYMLALTDLSAALLAEEKLCGGHLPAPAAMMAVARWMNTHGLDVFLT